MAIKSISHQLVKGRSQIRGLTTNSQGSTRQVVSITDVISEGPIKGLVDGQHSVFLNNQKMSDRVDNIEGGQLSLSYTNGSTTVTGVPDLTTFSGTFYLFVVRSVETPSVTVESVNFSTEPQPFKNTPRGVVLKAPGLSFTENSKYFTRKTVGEKELARLVLRNGKSIPGYLAYKGQGGLGEYNEVIFHPLDITATLQREIEINTSGAVANKNATLEIDHEIIYRSGTEQLGTNFLFDTGSYVTSISDRAYTDYNSLKIDRQGPASFLSLRNISNSSLEFRTGHPDQSPIDVPGGIGTTSITASINQYMTKWEEDLSEEEFEQADESPIVTLTSSTMNLSPEQVSEVDEIRLNFSYDSLTSVSNEDGKEHESAAVFKITVFTYINGTEATGVETLALEFTRLHKENLTVPVSFEELIKLNDLRPFQDFKIVVERLTRHNGIRVLPNGGVGDKRDRLQANCKLASTTAITRERFTYPYTCYSNITFSSVDYPETPSRTYEIYGKLVKIPSNYTTREKNDGINAVYDGFWDGTFKSTLEYTDNPAWVFYDILTNNTYGLGTWISETDIDKYSLYRIAKYCDELVPDGRGGQEPRFRSNIYLAKQADAYKVLKDMASVFFGMLYWMDNQIVAVNDYPKQPLFTFAKSNVIDGAFSYESTGSKTRSNQIVVFWNNPDDNYSAESLLVEDRENIVSTGKIIKEDVSAFGCTSRSQAYRYGVWKLWTAKNQTEIVSFSTSIDAAFLAPGDIINIQDADRFNTSFSGRVKSVLSSTQIELDRQISLVNGRTYEIFLTFIDDTAETEENLSEDEVREVRADSKTITATSDQITSVFTLPSAFEVDPNVGAVWVIRESVGQADVEGSAKEYKILGITESSKNEYAITAVEYYNEKFDSVYGDLNLYTIQNIFPDYTNSFEVYPPANVYVALNSDPVKKGDEFKIMWDAPVDLDFTLFNDVSGYEIHHNIPNHPSPMKVGSNVRSVEFKGVSDGPYFAAVRTINTSGSVSLFETVNFDIEDKFRLNVPRKAEGVAFGGLTGAPPTVVDGSIRFVSGGEVIPNPGISTIVDPEGVYSGTITTVDLSTLVDGTYEILFDRSSTTLVPLVHKTVAGAGYWYKPGEEFITITTTSINFPQGTNKLEAVGSSFKTDLSIGDIVYFENTNVYAKVTNIFTDTLIALDRSFPQATTGVIKKAGFTIDFRTDSLVAKVTKLGSSYTTNSYLSIDASLLPQNAINISITSSSGGTFFKNNTGTEKTLSVVASDAGTGDDLTSQIINYKWLKDGAQVYIDTNNKVVPSGTAGAVAANGNFPNIIVGPEDIADGSSELIEVEITI